MKILFIPEPKKEETSERSPQMIKVLKRKHEVVFLKPEEYWIKKRSFWPLRAWERFHINKKLIEEGKKMDGIDLVFCRDYTFALPGSRIARHLRKPCVWDSEGSMKAFWEDHHKYPTQVLPWLPAEKWLSKRVNYMITVTERDRRGHIEQGMDPNRIHIIPICVRSELFSQKTKEEARQALQLASHETFFLFFSNFNYLPNRMAINFLNEKVAPHLPGKLLLCGQGNLPKKLHPKIEYLGFLPLQKLYDLIRASDVCLSPIWEANGTLTKVLDMLGHGAATVITPAGQKGVRGLQDGVHALVAQDKEDFIYKTLLLAKNPTLQSKLKKSGPEVVQKNHEWKLYENQLLTLVESFGNNGH
ncbi:MAG: hypothetical protein A2W61_01335 [Deltaproteobacteria bacterium RIFCSPLOWO2_01_44_7]|nr:MAG: hypothetical protein A2712_02355 [Deltaproteobacteria bacterium RIFCSPHIGHO2_01_FULL_43_49]OGQ15034.1 MAG: hypothetical protein A3D22_03125 [Deltaproteobacteria bacterium RIFCSPHIGHO2_02_FULL_44_53]OGQ27347.1 MAG: hypothetical protein A3D98_02950 [Deltaproteobacteria bacterium RIFCSPHIGHO2_12_FULL_44_21]OGQ31551.1 MAG: hypothetical protein A2979_04285 [Deltaproteobacteria bacterium RIFCSPLOWO2_01_FULL_45_74]OGQ39020.1 MAG: hypothetical protein A2W61_01335 [Deltaproteobacteria bacterium 